jgi:hypothetical protein
LVNFKETKVKILPHDFSTSNNVSNGTSIFIDVLGHVIRDLTAKKLN